MAEVTQALIYQTLIELQQQMASLAEEMDDCRREAHEIQAHLHGTIQGVRNIVFVLSRNDGHLRRIERHLGIVEAG